ncbi:hypothetical protein N0V85_006825 [Neurospora sp. IMI 360204]|nr:hypothetical protein N0V85_006825 [Neurospora sp. IMI 360204]
MDPSQSTALIATLVQDQLPYLIKQVICIFATITMMGWTMTYFLDQIHNLQQEQVEQLNLISRNLRTTSNDTLTALKSMVAAAETTTEILKIQARQLDVLLKEIGVKEGKKPWLPFVEGKAPKGNALFMGKDRSRDRNNTLG